jgi:aryl-alcohol dehydrogenase-like predicted oxidoreductase
VFLATKFFMPMSQDDPNMHARPTSASSTRSNHPGVTSAIIGPRTMEQLTRTPALKD